MPTVTCSNCLKSREVVHKEKRSTDLCRTCAHKLRVRPKVEKKVYTRTCPECPEDEATIVVSSKANSGIKLCGTHRALARFAEIPKARYFRICPDCPPETATVQVANKSSEGIRLCRPCLDAKRRGANYERNRAKREARQEAARQHKEQQEAEKAEVRRLRALDRDEKRIARESAKPKLKPKPEPKVRKPRVVTKKYIITKPKRTKYVSPQAIEKAREINRQHRERIEEAKAKVDTFVPDDEKESSMIALWLSNNKPSVEIVHDEPFPFFSQQMYLG